MHYAVIDTNVLISAALKWDSVPGRIILCAFQGGICPLLNETVFREYREVLLRPKFHLTPSLTDDLLTAMQTHAIWINAPMLSIELPDPKDRVFYEVLMESRKYNDTVLITGNIKHFPSEEYILTPREMLNRLI